MSLPTPSAPAPNSEPPSANASQNGPIPAPIHAPWIPHAITRQRLSQLSWSTLLSTATSIILAFVVLKQNDRAPWILRETDNGFEDASLERTKITRVDLERYLSFIIPNLLGHIAGQAPGLHTIEGLLNQTVITTQAHALKSEENLLKTTQASQTLLVTGINPDQTHIDYARKQAYVEFFTTAVITKNSQTTSTQTQWRAKLYLVPPTQNLTTSNTKGTIPGNRFGLYLWQLDEQTLGTTNTDNPIPKAPPIPTTNTPPR